MNENRTCTWTGASGRTYTYNVYSLPQSFNTGQDGNYNFTKQDGGVRPAIYIGQGDLGERIGEDHHKWDCIEAKGATEVHVHLNKSEDPRLAEEEDL